MRIARTYRISLSLSISLLSQAPTSHRLRLWILEPDSNELDSLPIYLDSLRSIRIWSPSSLPEASQLPEVFFRSQDVMFFSAKTARAAFSVGGLKSTRQGKPTSQEEAEEDDISRQEAIKAMRKLDDQEADVSRLYKALELEPDISSTLSHTLDMNVRCGVAARCLLWRKSGLWSDFNFNPNRDSPSAFLNHSKTLPNLFRQRKLLPSVSRWLVIVQGFVGELNQSLSEYQTQVQEYNQQQQIASSSSSTFRKDSSPTSSVPKLSISVSELNSFSSHLNLLSQMTSCMGIEEKEPLQELQDLSQRLHSAISQHFEIRKSFT